MLLLELVAWQWAPQRWRSPRWPTLDRVHSADLEDIEHLEAYIDRSSTILVFCSKGYFGSKNCMRELARAVTSGKPMITVIDPDSSSGAMSVDEIRAALKEVGSSTNGLRGVASTDCAQALFAHAPIDWNRLGAFQE